MASPLHRSRALVTPLGAVALVLATATAAVRHSSAVSTSLDGLPSATERFVDLAAGSYDTRVVGGPYNDQLGNDLDVGDVNGDGIDDLLMGAHWSGGAGRNIVGRAYVLFGRAIWLKSYDLANRGAADWSVRGVGSEARLGSAVAVGNVGGDSTADLVIGSLLADPFGQIDAGATVVLFGGRGVSGDIDLEDTAADVQFAGDSRTRDTDQLGSDARVCDLNGDGAGDVVVAASNRGDGNGAVFVWWGPFAKGATYNLRHAAADWTILGDRDRSWFGSNIACGDTNGDGVDDLVASVGQAAVPDPPVDGGFVLVFRGGADVGGVIDATPEQAAVTVVGWDGAMLGMARSTIRSGRGRPLKVADVTGDTHADLLIGSPLGSGRRGSVVVLPGPITGELDLRTAPHLRVTTDLAEARLGWSLDTGHLTPSDSLDVVVAAPGATAGEHDKAGIAFGMLGPLRPTGEARVDDLASVVVWGPQASAGNAGMSLALGDVTGDGSDDLAMGFPDAAPFERRASGAVYVLRGPLIWRDSTAIPSPQPTSRPTDAAETPTVRVSDTPTVPAADTSTVPTADTPTVPTADTPTVPTADTPTVPAATPTSTPTASPRPGTAPQRLFLPILAVGR